MRTIVSGGRDASDESFVFRILNSIHEKCPLTLIIDGKARGIDTFAYNWRIANDLPGQRFPAQWEKYGRYKAGPIRNQQMLDEGNPDLLISFPGGNGTADMKRRALSIDLPVITVKENGMIHDPNELV